MTGTAAADPVADGAGAQAPATVVPPGMRSGRWNSSDKAQLEDAVGVARLFGASCVRVIRPGYATIEVDLKHEKAAGDRESVKAAERSYIERTAPKKKELTDEQLAAKAASRKAKKNRQKERRAKEAGERAAASEAERAERPRAQLRANIEYVMDGGYGLQLRGRAARPGPRLGSHIRCPQRGTTDIGAALAWCAPRSPRAPWRRPSPRTGSRTSWPSTERLMRHAATNMSCT